MTKKQRQRERDLEEHLLRQKVHQQGYTDKYLKRRKQIENKMSYEELKKYYDELWSGTLDEIWERQYDEEWESR